MVTMAENIHPALVKRRGLLIVSLVRGQEYVLSENLPTTKSIHEIQAGKGNGKVDDRIDNAHGERVYGSDVTNEDSTVAGSKCLAGGLLKEVHGHDNSGSLEILALEEFDVSSLLGFLLQRVLESRKLLVDLGLGLFSLAKLPESCSCFFGSILG